MEFFVISKELICSRRELKVRKWTTVLGYDSYVCTSSTRMHVDSFLCNSLPNESYISETMDIDEQPRKRTFLVTAEEKAETEIVNSMPQSSQAHRASHRS